MSTGATCTSAVRTASSRPPSRSSTSSGCPAGSSTSTRSGTDDVHKGALMRRVVMALLGTLVGTVLLVGLKAYGSPGSATIAAVAPPDPTPTGAGPGPAGPTASGGPGTTPTPAAPTPTGAGRGRAGPTARGGRGTPPSAGAPTPAGPPGATTPPPAGGGAPTPAPRTSTPTTASRTITGTAFAARTAKSPNCGECSGNMQVRIVVTGRHIDSIQTIQVSNRPKSVASTLTQQALTAQSANVGNVSGATYSALAWKQSLQSAINQL